MKEFTMSMYASKQDLLEDKCKYLEKALLELSLYFSSGNDVPVSGAYIKTSDFCKILGITQEDLIADKS